MLSERWNIYACAAENHIRYSILYEIKSIAANSMNPIYYSNTGCLFARLDTIDFRAFQYILEGRNNSSLNLDSAYYYLNQALSLSRDEPLFAINLSLTTALKGDISTAIDIIEPFIQDGAVTCELLCLRGILEEAYSNVSEACKYYSQAMVLYPSIIGSRFYKELYQRDSITSKYVVTTSIDKLSSLYETDRSPITAAKLGRLIMESGDIDYAKSLFDFAVNELPTLNRPWYHLGIIAEKQDDKYQAFKYFKKSYSLDESDLLPLQRLIQYDADYKYQMERVLNNKISDQAYRLQEYYGAHSLESPYVINNLESYFRE